MICDAVDVVELMVRVCVCVCVCVCVWSAVLRVDGARRRRRDRRHCAVRRRQTTRAYSQ